MDIEKIKNEEDILNCLQKISEKASKVNFSHLKNIPWLPKCWGHIICICSDLLLGGNQLSSDNPGFNDAKYKESRMAIESISLSFVFDDQCACPIIDYTEEETKLWTFMWDKLIPLHEKHACDEFKARVSALIDEKVFQRERIPQLSEINEFFKNRSKTFFRPTRGLLAEREFLNSLALRVFLSTQYIRHSSKPLYTPEPEIVHEFLGLAAMIRNLLNFPRK